ncbi:hypothetical protein LGL55_19570 [Clostridium tagluense]|uniref:hypothetical protein n=1 Tax=Clostridium tagluense TaxID=360422 RepID=UPI001C0B22F7|nr:hypothetical protein [Clostridium tagluense]MBU3129924.1 hypothetical protein [Clostridium tagluense]MCB2311939.1 hypothetical protein [Clostridium tagluense]MCB2318150.1 hypothetical protein [Clostridium tagluense]MCB2323313.1 hypothetical protein [Clostridium tagluense]MCB2327934.1 hypothetical protein [Clostridium tagluense]
MKKVAVLCSSIIITSLLASGCTSNYKKNVPINNKNTESSVNPFDLNDEKSDVQAAFGFGPVNPVDELSYTGAPIQQEYFYDNVGGADCNLGFMIFIDGIAQSYKINGENTEEIMHKFDVKKKSKIMFKASFKPNIGKKGDKLGLYVTTIVNPKHVPSVKSPDFGNNLALSQVLPVNLKYVESANNSQLKVYDKYLMQNVTEKIKNQYLSADESNKGKYVSNQASLFYLKYNGDYKGSKIELKKTSKLSLTLEGLCGPNDGKYRTTIYIDNKPVKTIDGKDYLEMQLKKGMLSKQNFDVDINGITGIHVLYTISVPQGNDYSILTNPIVESSCKLLVIGE